jgi:phosphoglycolate phosphatase
LFTLHAYSGVVFDLDGTLVDSAPIVGFILNGMRTEVGLPPLDDFFYRKWSSEGGATLVGRALDVDPSAAQGLLSVFRRKYYEYATPMNSVYDGVIPLLEKLRVNSVKLGICSNKPERLCNKVLIDTGLYEYFDVVTGGDTLSNKKPEPDGLIHTLSAMSVRPSAALFVGDSIIDQLTATRANLDFALFTGGYDAGAPLKTDHISFANYDDLYRMINSNI